MLPTSLESVSLKKKTGKVLALMSTHLIIGKRFSLSSKGLLRWALLLFYFLIAINPLILGYTIDSKLGTILIITVFSCWNFGTFSIIKSSRAPFQLHQIKIYPLSNRLIFYMFWSTELFDYNLMMFVIPSIGFIFIFYPDFYTIAFSLLCIFIGYILMSLTLIEIKLLMSQYRQLKNIIVIGYVVSALPLMPLWTYLSKENPERMVELISNWSKGIYFITAFFIVFLYKLVLLTLSRFTK